MSKLWGGGGGTRGVQGARSKDCFYDIYLGTNSTCRRGETLFFTFELFELSHSSIYKQVQASELIPIIFRRWGGWSFRRPGGHSEDGTGLGHVQRTVVRVLQRTEVWWVGERDWLVRRGRWGRQWKWGPWGQSWGRGPIVATVVFFAATTWTHRNERGGRVECWSPVIKNKTVKTVIELLKNRYMAKRPLS